MSEPIRYGSYLVRVWSEPGAAEPHAGREWHGEVEHIQTGDSWQFDRLTDLLAFLRERGEEVEAAGAIGKPRPAAVSETD